MTHLEKLLICKSLDNLWGAVSLAHDICEMNVDRQDRRILDMKDALCKAQDAILDLNQAFGIEKH